MAKRVSKKNMNKAILVIAAGYNKLFEHRTFEIDFSKGDSIVLQIILREEFDKVVGITPLPIPEELPENIKMRLDNTYHLPQMAKTVLAQGIRNLETKLQNAYHQETTVELDRDDFQMISFAIPSHLDDLCNRYPDLVECLAQLAKMFMGIDNLDDTELMEWLRNQAEDQLRELND